MTAKKSALDKLFDRSEFRCDQVCVAGHVVGPRYRTQCAECLRDVRAARLAAKVPRRVMTPEERKERQRENLKRWREKNPERAKFLTKRWQLEHRDRRKNAKHVRRAAQVGGATASEVAALRSRYGRKCAICAVRGRLTIDHIVPLSAGGAHAASNIQFLCSPCNSAKRDLPMAEFARTMGLLL